MAGAGDARRNNFGLVRLVLAALVIVGNLPEIMDGNRSREALTRLFGTMSFAEAAVDGFFLLSGYLIAKSYAETPHLLPFLARRVLRIVPAFFVCFWLSVALGGLVGGHLSWGVVARNAHLLIYLLPPSVPGAFDGLGLAGVNLATWTLGYEFRCYLGAAALGFLAVRLGWRWSVMKWWLLAAVLVGLVVNGAGWLYEAPVYHDNLFGGPVDDVRFFSVFGMGVLFYAFRDRLALTGKAALVAAVVLCLGLTMAGTAEFAVAVAGGTILFWFALRVRALPCPPCDARTDISYGVYLYAWPIGSLLVYVLPAAHELGPLVLAVPTLLLAAAAGWCSWVLIERHAIALGRRLTPYGR